LLHPATARFLNLNENVFGLVQCGKGGLGFLREVAVSKGKQKIECGGNRADP
jgi:hypothetical protein